MEGNPVEIQGWEGLVMGLIEHHWAADEVFSRQDIYLYEPYFAQHYLNNHHIRTKLRHVLQILVKNEEIEALGQAGYRRIHQLQRYEESLVLQCSPVPGGDFVAAALSRDFNPGPGRSTTMRIALMHLLILKMFVATP